MNTLRTTPCSARTSSGLTETEVSCLRLIAEGLQPQEAARILDLPQGRFELALSSAQAKLGARNVMQAISSALLTGTIAKDEISASE
ncbi:LuxR C-terminal-related transcriptional regulator [Rhizobium sp. AAP43]|uniref:LuxR C-terminal-related transcriptional regulator n=1 Tax=Rhizobium sp. AAP43 TaxID=1523420 RepID=UPI0009EBE29F